MSATGVFFAAAPDARVLTVVSTALRYESSARMAPQGRTHMLVGDCRDVLGYAVADGAFGVTRGADPGDPGPVRPGDTGTDCRAGHACRGERQTGCPARRCDPARLPGEESGKHQPGLSENG